MYFDQINAALMNIRLFSYVYIYKVIMWWERH